MGSIGAAGLATAGGGVTVTLVMIALKRRQKKEAQCRKEDKDGQLTHQLRAK